MPFNRKFLPKIRKSFHKFKQCCRRAENGDTRKLWKLLQNKKMFSVPWLLCSEIYFMENGTTEEKERESEETRVSSVVEIE